MKLSKYGLLLGSLALLASCSNDNITGPDNNTQPGGDFDAAYFTVAISEPGVRTSTPNQGSEKGQTSENIINTAQLLFGQNGKVVAHSEVVNVGGQDASAKPIVRTFIVNNGKSNEVLKGQGTVDVYVVCNATLGTITDGTTDVQQVLEIGSAADDTYWAGTKGFLMTNYKAKTWDLSDLAISNDENNPTDLGAMKVQRAAARFDIKTNATPESTIPSNVTADATTTVGVTFDGVALVNVSRSFYLFKDVWNANATPAAWQLFATETATNFVNDPNAATKAALDNTAGHADYETYFFNVASTLAPKDMTFTDFSALTGDPNTVTGGDMENKVNNNGYKIWTYCSPNSLYSSTAQNGTPLTANYKYQKNGNSTGIVFRAKINAELPGMEDGDKIYAYRGYLYGNATAVQAAITTPNVANNAAMTENNQRLAALIMSTQGAVVDGELQPLTDDILAAVKNENFVTYTASEVDNQKVYYCYYYYWNQHNAMTDKYEMGPMEFAVVRNNIYKLAVTSVSHLGFPGEVSPINPNDPDKPEEDVNAYIRVSVSVVDWSVRENGIEF